MTLPIESIREEYLELQKKISKLKFKLASNGSTPDVLDKSEVDLLSEQLEAMERYSELLLKRTKDSKYRFGLQAAPPAPYPVDPMQYPKPDPEHTFR